MNDGDLTTTVTPTTTPMEVRDGEAVGQLAEVFNLKHGNPHSANSSYNDKRRKLAAMIDGLIPLAIPVLSAPGWPSLPSHSRT